ncbi:class I SAM-dependent methyltransferase [Mycobacteroides salmoniphilum]|uniref:class I SAM-dependent methyltransferase n=1 Tax=Mycobacteroides salmoniphilum TaxID=404941 RepID=UPI001F1BFF06|nr:class I SAM-dependent methyltransferase [Mycobacteroides salmoniphilum]
MLLGAGLDTFAYRNTTPDLQVFEIDHPAIQEWKRARLTAVGITIPETSVCTPVDFETHDLTTELERTAFSRSHAPNPLSAAGSASSSTSQRKLPTAPWNTWSIKHSPPRSSPTTYRPQTQTKTAHV